MALGSAQANTAIPVVMTTANGTVPGTGITYTIGISGDTGGPRNIFPSTSSDNGVWSWTGGFPEFLSFGTPETLTVTFSAPVPIDDFVLGLNSISDSTSTLTVAGGTAGTADFNLSDGLQVYTGATGDLIYTPATGVFTNNPGNGQNQSLMLGSTSTNTVTSFTLSAGASDGGADGYTVFVGFVQPGSSSVPEPSTAILFGAGLGLLGFGRGFLRRCNAR
jgi:hypothetical protein